MALEYFSQLFDVLSLSVSWWVSVVAHRCCTRWKDLSTKTMTFSTETCPKPCGRPAIPSSSLCSLKGTLPRSTWRGPLRRAHSSRPPWPRWWKTCRPRIPTTLGISGTKISWQFKCEGTCKEGHFPVCINLNVAKQRVLQYLQIKKYSAPSSSQRTNFKSGQRVVGHRNRYLMKLGCWQRALNSLYFLNKLFR